MKMSTQNFVSHASFHFCTTIFPTDDTLLKQSFNVATEQIIVRKIVVCW